MSELKPCQMTTERAIEQVTRCYSACGVMNSENKEFIDFVIAALRRVQPDNAPLTLEDLLGMEGEPVYIKLLDLNEEFWVLRCEWVDTRTPEPLILFHFRWYSHSDYGKTWLAYRRKLEQEGGEV